MRNLAIDRSRTFLTLVVLLHHAVIPYTYYGHSDSVNWIGFDAIVLANDSFFMAAFFFLSGLFVWPGLRHKSSRAFLKGRLFRLGVPFAIGALTLIPLAYYASALRQTADLSFQEFWWKTVTVGPWPSGPIWFLWVLLSFDLTALAIKKYTPNLITPIQLQASKLWMLLVTVSGIAYIPFLIYFGPTHWIELGPFSVQTSRIFLYASYFFIGAGVGSSNLRIDRRWKWATIALLSYALLWFMIYIKRGVLENPPVQPWWYHVMYGLFYVVFSASILLAIVAFFQHANSARFLDLIQSEAYGMFLVHYPITLWVQYFLYDQSWPAIAKASLAFAMTVILSWATTAYLRKIPGVSRVL